MQLFEALDVNVPFVKCKNSLFDLSRSVPVVF